MREEAAQCFWGGRGWCEKSEGRRGRVPGLAGTEDWGFCSKSQETTIGWMCWNMVSLAPPAPSRAGTAGGH